MKMLRLIVSLLILLNQSLTAEIIIQETFNSNAGLPLGWSSPIVQGANAWTIATSPAFSSPSSNRYAVFNDFNLGAGVTPNQTSLQTPAFDCSGHTSVFLSFYHYWYAVEFTHGYVEISNDGGISWAILMDNELATIGSLAAPAQEIIDITPYAANQSSVRVRFRYTDGGVTGRYWYLDDISVYSSPDVSVSELIAPAYLGCASPSYSSSESITVQISNRSLIPITNIPVTCIVSGATSQTITATYTGTPISGLGTVNFTLPSTVNMSAQGVYHFQIFSSLGGDAYIYNDTLLTGRRQRVQSYPYIENFNSSQGGWQGSQLINGREFVYGELPYLNGAEGNGNSWYINTISSSISTEIYLESPVFDFSNVTNPRLSFDIKYRLHSSNYVRIQYSINGGTNWITLGTATDPNWYSYSTQWGNNLAAPVDTWTNVTKRLCDLSGEPCVKFRIQARPYYSSPTYVGYHHFSIDNFFVGDDQPDDIDVRQFLLPSNASCSGLLSASPVRIVVGNNTCRPIYNIPVALQLDGGAVINEVIPGPINRFSAAIYNFSATLNLSAPGNHLISATVSLPTDSFPSNNTHQISIDGSSISSFPYLADFNSGNQGWTVKSSSATDGTRYFVHGDLPYLNGAEGYGNSFYVETVSSNNSTEIYVESPVFDLSSVVNPQLVMEIKYQLHSSNYSRVQYSLNGGSTWSTLGTSTDPNWYNYSSQWGNNLSTPVDSWDMVQRSLCLLSGQPCVKFRVMARPYYSYPTYNAYEYFAFDNFRIVDGVDVGAYDFVSPVDQGCLFSANQPVTVRIFNSSCGPMTNIPIKCDISGPLNTSLTGTVPGPIAVNTYYSYTFPSTVNLTDTGTYNVKVYTELPFDANPANDTVSTTLYVEQITISNFPYLQDFDSGTEYWIASGAAPPNNNGRNFLLGNLPYLNGPQGNGDSWYVNTSTSSQSTEIWVESPVFDFSQLTNPRIAFDIKYRLHSSDYVRIQYSINGGANWLTLGASGEPDWYNYSTQWGNNLAAPVDSWTTVTRRLCDLSGEPCVKFRILARPYYSSPTYIGYEYFSFDNFFIGDGQPDDIDVRQYLLPASPNCSGLSATSPVRVIVANNTCRPLTNIPITLQLDAGPVINEVVPGPVNRFSAIIYTFTATVNLSAPGLHTLVTEVSIPTDSFPANNSKTLVIDGAPINTFPYLVDFDSGNQGWSPGSSSSTDGTRYFVNDTLPYLDGAEGHGKSWYVEALSSNNSTEIWVESPVFDFTGVVNPQLVMEIKYQLHSSNYVRVQYSTNGGTSWITLGTSTDPDWYNYSSQWGNNLSTPVDEWQLRIRNLCFLAGNPCVKFRVLARPYYSYPNYLAYEYFGFDNFGIVDGGDVGVSLYLSPVDQGCLFTSNHQVSVRVFNNACGPMTNVPIQCDITGANNATLTGVVPGPIPVSGFVVYTFPAVVNLTALGHYDISTFTTLPFDPSPSNDTLTTSLDVDQITINSFPYAENFNSGTGYWIASGQAPPLNNGRNFILGTPPYLNGSGSNGDAWYIETTTSNVSTEIWVESPVFDFSTLVSPQISVDLKYQLHSSNYTRVQYSINGGTSWVNLGSSAEPNWTNYSSQWGNNLSTPVDQWTSYQHHACMLAGLPCVKFRILARPYYSTPTYANYANFAFDNFTISEGNDIKMVSYISPFDGGCLFTTNHPVTVRLYNSGCGSASNIPVIADISGTLNTTLTGVVPGPLANNAFVNYTFPTTVDLTPIGPYDFTTRSNLGGDLFAINDTIKTSIDVDQITISSFPYVEDFESGSNFWIATGQAPPLNNGRNFVLGQVPYLNGSEGYGDVWYIETTSSSSSTEIYLESPVFDLSAVTNPKLSLDVKYQLHSSNYARVQYSINGGNTWLTLGSSTDPNWYNYSSQWGNNLGAPVDSWQRMSIGLCGLIGQSCVKFRVLARPYYSTPTYSGYEYFAFDNFMLTDTPVDAKCDFVSGCYGSEYSLELDVFNELLACAAAPVIQDLQVHYIVNGGSVVTIPFSGLNISQGNSQRLSIPNVNIPDNLSDVEVWVTLPNSEVDQEFRNDSIKGNPAIWPNCNDHCSNATTIYSGITELTQTSFATSDAADDPPFGSCQPITIENTVWYKFDTNVNGDSVTIRIDNQICSPSQTGVQISLLKATVACDPSTYSEVFCSANNDTTAFEYGPEPLDAASTYYLAVDGFAGGFCDFRLSLFGAEIDPLPVELISFEAICLEDKNKVELTWATLSETNNHHFTLEKSFDAAKFSPVAVVLGSGNSNKLNEYEHITDTDAGRTVYFRLKQTDFNGHVEYSQIIASNCGSDFDVLMYPNPAISFINLELKGDRNEEVSIQITDSRGRTLLTKTATIENKELKTFIDVEALSNGVYPVIIHKGSTIITKRLIINR